MPEPGWTGPLGSFIYTGGRKAALGTYSMFSFLMR